MPRGALRRWPTRYRSRIDGVQDAQTLTEAEWAEKDRWLARGAKLLGELELPIVEIAEGALDPEGLLRKALGEKWLRALRIHIGGVEKYRE